MKFSDVVKEYMEKRELNNSDIARKSGYSVQYISDLLAGKRRWNETTIEKVCNVLGLKIVYSEIKNDGEN